MHSPHQSWQVTGERKWLHLQPRPGSSRGASSTRFCLSRHDQRWPWWQEFPMPLGQLLPLFMSLADTCGAMASRPSVAASSAEPLPLLDLRSLSTQAIHERLATFNALELHIPQSANVERSYSTIASKDPSNHYQHNHHHHLRLEWSAGYSRTFVEWIWHHLWRPEILQNCVQKARICSAMSFCGLGKDTTPNIKTHVRKGSTASTANSDPSPFC